MAIVGFLVFTNLVSLALLYEDYRARFPEDSKPQGDLIIVSERVPNSAATPEFKFTKIPSPTPTNAATFAQFSVVAGRPSGAGVYKLQESYLPNGPDAPDDNFFFADGTYGGRFMIDFHKTIAIKEINTYSWHTGPRAPQVYKLYAKDNLSSLQPIGYQDPVKLGWKYLAEVDTRPKGGDMGGQYGVSITSPEGLIGNYRYLLFDCQRTEGKDRWGNTFYSKVDVIAQ
jgi:hypothetical protein